MKALDRLASWFSSRKSVLGAGDSGTLSPPLTSCSPQEECLAHGQQQHHQRHLHQEIVEDKASRQVCGAHMLTVCSLYSMKPQR